MTSERISIVSFFEIQLLIQTVFCHLKVIKTLVNPLINIIISSYCDIFLSDWNNKEIGSILNEDEIFCLYNSVPWCWHDSIISRHFLLQRFRVSKIFCYSLSSNIVLLNRIYLSQYFCCVIIQGPDAISSLIFLYLRGFRLLNEFQ